VPLPWGKLETCAIQSYEYNRANGQVTYPPPPVQGLDLCNGLCQALIVSGERDGSQPLSVFNLC
jgi:hypothetical protein